MSGFAVYEDTDDANEPSNADAARATFVFLPIYMMIPNCSLPIMSILLMVRLETE